MVICLFRTFQRLIRSWWHHDRIRVSRRDGRLLRIQVGDLLSIGSIRAEVVSRNIRQDSCGQFLQWQCVFESGSAVLCVSICPDQASETTFWNDREISADDIQIWPR